MSNYAILDMDGVLADFVGAMCKTHGLSSPYYEGSPWLGYWDLAEAWGLTNNEFWEPTRSREWWAEVEPTEEYEEVLDLIEAYFAHENIFVCTARSKGHAKAGAVDWIERWMPDYKKQLITTPGKHILRTDSILIDDAEFNVDQFGGEAILFPRPWNRCWDEAHPPYNVRAVNEILQKLKPEAA